MYKCVECSTQVSPINKSSLMQRIRFVFWRDDNDERWDKVKMEAPLFFCVSGVFWTRDRAKMQDMLSFFYVIWEVFVEILFENTICIYMSLFTATFLIAVSNFSYRGEFSKF